jgi:hypothetical protein
MPGRATPRHAKYDFLLSGMLNLIEAMFRPGGALVRPDTRDTHRKGAAFHCTVLRLERDNQPTPG